MNDDNFNSIMNTSRRFEEIRVDPGAGVVLEPPKKKKKKNEPKENILAERITAIVGKFQSKKLLVSHFPLSSEKIYSNFLEATSDVENLTLLEYRIQSKDDQIMRNYVLKKEFTKLKELTIDCIADHTGILNKIPDNALVSLSVDSQLYKRPVINEASLQAFINRQTSLKRIKISQELDLSRLVLEELSLCGRMEFDATPILKQQHALRYFKTGYITETEFDALQEMQQLEVLHANVDEDVFGELKSLKELKFRTSNCSVMRQVLMPKLERLLLSTACHQNSLKADDFVALSLSAQNLQHIRMEYNKIDFLAAIIENFPALKTLRIFCGHSADLSSPAPSRKNLSLEELLVDNFEPSSMGVLFDIIMACPNLKRIKLNGIKFTEEQILELMRNHPNLTHFWFSSQYKSEDEYDDRRKAIVWGPISQEVIDVFKSSVNFIQLTIRDVADWSRRLVNDDDQITVTKNIRPSTKLISLKLTKKSVPHDPFKDFYVQV